MQQQFDSKQVWTCRVGQFFWFLFTPIRPGLLAASWPKMVAPMVYLGQIQAGFLSCYDFQGLGWGAPATPAPTSGVFFAFFLLRTASLPIAISISEDLGGKKIK